METDYIRLKEIKPALAGYISDAQQILQSSPVPGNDEVHHIRVLLKRARAALKLINSQIDLEYAGKDIASLKEAAGLMRDWRDNSVLRRTLKDLRKEHPDLFEHLAGNEKIDFIIRKPEPVSIPSEEVSEGIIAIGELLKKTAYRVRFHSLDKLDPNLLLKELDNSYQATSAAFLDCRNNPKAKKLHDFRKKSKEFLYQLYFFRPLNSSCIKALEKKLEELTRNLGKYNDLAQLVKAFEYKFPDTASNNDMNELVLRIREKQDEYLCSVWPVASRVFSPGRKLVAVLGYKILVF
ncbi:MAG TPA: CHAD domain-containing protein [Bacteroidales bacterium]|nr:CHAD domain-containing protein [Bacteroidales bacterium]